MEYTHDENCTCPGCINWDTFDNIYIDFAMEYSQQMLMFSLASESLSNFPMNMAPHIIQPIMTKRLRILEDEIKRRGLIDEIPMPDEIAEGLEQDVELSPELERIRYAFEGVYALARYGKEIPEMEFPDFQRVLICQNIIVVCSFAEGFIANTIRFLCDVCPAPFDAWGKKRGGKIKNMSKPDRIESYAFEIGFGSFDKKIEHIEAEFSIRMTSSASDRRKLNELYLMRNCIIHNAGRVSKVYKDSGMAPPHLNIGDEMELLPQSVEELLDTLIDVIADLYRSVSLQVLKKPVERLMFGPQRM